MQSLSNNNKSKFKILIMSDFKTRLIEEQSQLEEKLNKLDEFLVSDEISSIDDTQLALLRVQSIAMNAYNRCLEERIERL